MYEDNENQTGNVEKSLNIKTTRSEVWNHFVVEIRTNSTYKTICKYCGNSFVCKKNSGTIYLNCHIKFSCKTNPYKDMKHMFPGKSPRPEHVFLL